MSLQLNSVMLAGNLTRDVEYKALGNDRSVANTGMAINRTWKDAQGERQQETTFLDLEAWGQPAEFLASYFSKGMPIFITGRLKLETWKDKDTGANRSRIKVLVDRVQFVESKGGDAEPVVIDGEPTAATGAGARAATAAAIAAEQAPF